MKVMLNMTPYNIPLPRSNTSSMQAHNGSAENSYNGSPAPISHISAATFVYKARYPAGDLQTFITPFNSQDYNETVTTYVDYLKDYPSIIPTVSDQGAYAISHSCYTPYLDIDGDYTPAHPSQTDVAASVTAYNKSYFESKTVYAAPNPTDQATTYVAGENTGPPSPSALRWASKYTTHEAIPLSLPRENSENQHRKEIDAVDSFESTKTSSSGGKKYKSSTK